ncbi:MAG: PP2C family serine/threonine-protein phosphatase [Thermoplasmataceae archaeon]
MKIQDFHLSKLGNPAKEYEDSLSFDLKKGRFAIADGASGSTFSDIWARSLTETFVSSNVDLFRGRDNVVNGIVSASRDQWYDKVNWKALPWFLKNKSISGSYSTFLALQIKKTAGRLKFASLSIGDSCMFILDGDKIKESFPLKTPVEFGNTPDLIWSGQGSPVKKNLKVPEPEPKMFSGFISPGETVLLATDAAAKWIMEDPIYSMDLFRNDFLSLDSKIPKLINEKKIKNDDFTIALLEFTDP